MKGGGLACHKRFFQNVFCTRKVWALYYIQIAVEVTMNLAEYTRSWQSAAGEAKECQYLNQLIKRLKNDIS